MKISWKWLSTLIDLSGTSPEEVADKLTLSGMEVEGIERFGHNPDFDSIVVGQIKSIEPHPSADKLVVCQVDGGAEQGVLQIVCGARNMSEGDRVDESILALRKGGKAIVLMTTRGDW